MPIVSITIEQGNRTFPLKVIQGEPVSRPLRDHHLLNPAVARESAVSV